ncbi:MAG: hypothetical protein VYB92_11790, partial [Pseudomonadota bacterium]|nr:hypothetical protein [Pseudomonadota bacterium]
MPLLQQALYKTMPQRPLHRLLCMNLGRIEERHGSVGRRKQQADLGAAQQHPPRAPLRQRHDDRPGVGVG